jgi:hypothetical protein
LPRNHSPWGDMACILLLIGRQGVWNVLVNILYLKRLLKYKVEWFLSYCNVLGGSLFTKELYCTPKVNTLQLNTARNSSNTRTRPTRTVSEHSFLQNSSNKTSCGNLPTLTPILAVRKLRNTRWDNPSSGYRSTCTPQWHLGVYMINPAFTSPTIGCLHRPP